MIFPSEAKWSTDLRRGRYERSVRLRSFDLKATAISVGYSGMRPSNIRAFPFAESAPLFQVGPCCVKDRWVSFRTLLRLLLRFSSRRCHYCRPSRRLDVSLSPMSYHTSYDIALTLCPDVGEWGSRRSPSSGMLSQRQITRRVLN